jgi:hypothetical protein
MPALIDNYTALECVTETHPKVVNVRYVTEIQSPVSCSIIFSFTHEKGINHRIVKLLEEYKLLQNDWDENRASAPSIVALNTSLFLTKTLEKRGQSIFHAAPGPNGEIMLDLRNNKNTKSLEIIFYEDRAVSVLFPEGGKPSQQAFDFQELPKLLKWLNQK